MKRLISVHSLADDEATKALSPGQESVATAHLRVLDGSQRDMPTSLLEDKQYLSGLTDDELELAFALTGEQRIAAVPEFEQEVVQYYICRDAADCEAESALVENLALRAGAKLGVEMTQVLDELLEGTELKASTGNKRRLKHPVMAEVAHARGREEIARACEDAVDSWEPLRPFDPVWPGMGHGGFPIYHRRPKP